MRFIAVIVAHQSICVVYNNNNRIIICIQDRSHYLRTACNSGITNSTRLSDDRSSRVAVTFIIQGASLVSNRQPAEQRFSDSPNSIMTYSQYLTSGVRLSKEHRRISTQLVQKTQFLLIAVFQIISTAPPDPLLVKILRPSHIGTTTRGELAVSARSGYGIRYAS